MATVVDWSNVGGSNGGKTRFVKFSDGTNLRCRPVGKTVEFTKFFVKTENGNKSVCVDINDGDQAASILSNHSGQTHTGTHRYATNVIDRSDSKIYVLEGGQSIFKSFGDWTQANGSAPGSNAGGDWMIKAEGSGMKRRYSTTFLKQIPVTEQERATIKEEGGVYILEDVFKSVPLDKLVQIVFGDSANSESGPATSSEPQTVASSSGDDDLMF